MMNTPEQQEWIDWHAGDRKNPCPPRPDLSGAYLYGADLREADLARANLARANLCWANLTGANLYRADLRWAILTGVDLSGTDLTGANIPKIENIDATILARIEADRSCFDMSEWRNDCGTTMCRAGHAIGLAGEEGKKLEAKLGPSAAGALIYAASGSHPVPDWSATDDNAIADMRERANQ